MLPMNVYIQREVLAAETSAKLLISAVKVYVTLVNYVWDLSPCYPQVKLPAFAVNSARANFTVFIDRLQKFVW